MPSTLYAERTFTAAVTAGIANQVLTFADLGTDGRLILTTFWDGSTPGSETTANVWFTIDNDTAAASVGGANCFCIPPGGLYKLEGVTCPATFKIIAEAAGQVIRLSMLCTRV